MTRLGSALFWIATVTFFVLVGGLWVAEILARGGWFS